jgi:hypothetical protein
MPPQGTCRQAGFARTKNGADGSVFLRIAA